VQVNGVKLEPTLIAYNVESMRIDQVFGKEYDSRWDKDVTAYYIQIKNNTMYWFWDSY
jgi:hypothetical protein